MEPVALNNDVLAHSLGCGKIIERALATGLHVPVANGNTGEFYALTVEEAETMTAEIVAMVAGRAPVLAGVGRSVGDARRLARAAARAGAAGLMIHQPPHPFAAPRGVVDYVRHVAEAGQGLPVVFYLRNDALAPGPSRNSVQSLV